MNKAFEVMLNVILKIGMMLYTAISVLIVIFTVVSAKVLEVTVGVINKLSEFGGDSFDFSIDGDFTYLKVANAWLPIQETWALLVFAVPYMIVIVIFRFVKQFIPTLSN